MERQIQPRSVRIRAVVLASASVIFAGVLLAILLVRTPVGDVSVEFSDGIEPVGRVDNLIDKIEADGPIIYGDSSNSGRDAYVQHLGDDRSTGWFVFQARRAVASRGCPVEWDAGRRVFVDTCRPDLTFPENGEGLPAFDWSIDDRGDDDPANDQLLIDFRSEETKRRDAEADAATSTTVRVVE